MSDLSGMAWVWLPPEGTPVFTYTREACRTRFEHRQRFFQGLLGIRPAGADTLAPPLCKHLGSSAKFFHVAGTNGKGSVCAVLEGCLRALPGKKIGCFMSPHIHTFRERVRVNGELMDADRVGPLVEQAKAVAGEHARDFTFFDKLLLLAFLYFEEKKVDYIVFETGLGGRWDPTNVIEGTERLPVSIITSISKDHQEVLGDTLAKIAWEKAGIIKPGIPVVTMASQHPDVLQVFEEEARLRQTQLHVIDTMNEEATELVRPRLEGDTQRENVTLAMAALRLWLEREEASADEVDAKMRLLMSGLSLVFHPCRFEMFHVPAGGDAKCTIPLVIDGGHNEDGLHKLFDYAKKRFSGNRLVVVMGCSLYEKKLRECVDIVSQHAYQIAFVVSSHFKAAPVAAMRQKLYELLPGPESEVKGDVSVSHPKELAVEATEAGKPSVGDGIKAALARAASENTGEAPCVVMVCGSLFSAADARCFLTSLIPFPAHDWVHHVDPVTNIIKPYK